MPDPRELSFEQLERTASELGALGCKTVNVTGGEPLLRSEWAQICSNLTRLGMDVALVSNGTLFAPDNVSRAVDAGVSVISVSLDGLKATHDRTRRYVRGRASAFDAAVAGIVAARQRLPVSVITQVNRSNLGELRPLGQFLGSLGVSRWQLQLVVPTPKVTSIASAYALIPSDLETLTAFIVSASADPQIPMIHATDTIGYATPAEAILRRRAMGTGLWMGCVAGIRSVAIKYDGSIRGCSLLPAEFDAGSLHESTLTEIWNDKTRFAYSTAFDRSQLKGGCADCQHGSICRAGCTTMAYFATGTTGDNPYCLHRVQRQALRFPCQGPVT